MTIKEWFEKAKVEKFAIGAFNAGNFETVKAICGASENLKAPVIIESSPGETKYLGAYNLVSMVRNLAEEKGIEVFINLDHARSYDEVIIGIEAGYDLVHFDGSELPYEENVELAKRIVDEAHKEGVLVEGEFNRIGGSSELHDGSVNDLVDSGQARMTTGGTNLSMTDPEEALRFVTETGVDTLAVSIGNVHGYFEKGGEELNIPLLSEIREKVPSFLSLHGGSGISADQLSVAVGLGIVKINVNTELRMAYRTNLENVLKGNPEEIAMYKIMPSVVEAVREVVEEKIGIFGSGKKIE